MALLTVILRRNLFITQILEELTARARMGLHVVAVFQVQVEVEL